MDMLKSLKEVKNNENLLARPVSWVGHGCGIAWHENAFILYTYAGMTPAFLPGDEVWNEWETVTLEVVEAEADKLIESQTPTMSAG